MGKDTTKLKEAIADRLQLPKDILLDMPKIIITGDREICIENHKGIMSFENDILKVNSNFGAIEIKGKKLEILFIGGKTIIIGGKFKSINYEGGDSNKV